MHTEIRIGLFSLIRVKKNSKVRTGVGGWNRWRYEFIRLYPFGVAPKPA